MSAFERLNAVNVNGHTEKKNGLTYLTWAWAWAEVKKLYPDATYKIGRQENGLPYTFDPKTGYMVSTLVTIDGLTHEMWLPVMDGANKAMMDKPYTYLVKNPYFKYAQKGPDGIARDKYGNVQKEYVEKTCEAATMFDVNKALMRCLVKNLAMFGLGLYIYAGEDLPETVEEAQPQITENSQINENSQITENSPINETMINALRKLCGNHMIPESVLAGRYNKKKFDELTYGEYRDFAKIREAFVRTWDEDHPS